MAATDRVGLVGAPGAREGRERVADTGWAQDAHLSEAHEHGGRRDAVGVLEANDLVVGEAVPVGARLEQ